MVFQKNIRIAFALLCVLPFFSFGQKDTLKSTNIIDLSYGLNYNLKKDKTYSLLPRKGVMHDTRIQYKNSNAKRIYFTNVHFGIGTLGTGTNNVNLLTAYSSNVGVRYLKRINTIDAKKITLGLGGNVNFQTEIWFPKNSVLRYAWDINLSVGFSSLAAYKISKKVNLEYGLDVSLLGVLWRSHNNGQQLTTEEIQLEKGLISSAFETPRFSHVLNTLYLNNNVGIIYNVGKKINLHYRFNLLYRYIQQPLTKRGFDLNNVLGIQFKF